jgi:hypothetical protein
MVQIKKGLYFIQLHRYVFHRLLRLLVSKINSSANVRIDTLDSLLKLCLVQNQQLGIVDRVRS